MNLADDTTFSMALIKRVKSRFNQKIKSPYDTKGRIWKISINNGWNTQIVQILRGKCDGDFIFKVNFLSRLPKSVELSHK